MTRLGCIFVSYILVYATITKSMKSCLTAIILAKNEENTIIDCIESLGKVDEILIIDDNSTDRTIELVNSLKLSNLRIINHELNDDYARARNFALSQAKSDWVLFIDADERVSDGLRKEIKQVLENNSNYDGYYILRTDFFLGQQLLYGETGAIKLLRLGRKGKWMGKVHEVWNISGRTTSLNHPLYHYPHQSIRIFIETINRYTTLRAQELFQKKVKTSAIFIILYPTAKFFQNYILKRGYKDGTPGFIHAMIMSLHSFLVRAKLYSLWKN